MSEHTATPWHTEEFNPCSITAPNGKWNHRVVGVTYGDDPEATANAEFIVRAVNAHDALVEGIKIAIGQLEAHEDPEDGNCRICSAGVALADALALAEDK